MSEYNKLHFDLPERLINLDKKLSSKVTKEFEVTYLLMKLMMAFVFVNERITQKSGSVNATNQEAKAIKLALQWDRSFLGSKFHLTKSNESWSYKESVTDFDNKNGFWIDKLLSTTIATDIKCSDVFQHVRNAAAHSNFHFISTTGKDITHIFMGSQRSFRGTEYRVLMAPVDQLQYLVDSWLDVLNSLGNSTSCVAELFNDAA